MAKTIYLHFSTDAWHTHSSQELICATTSRKTGLKHVKAFLKKKGLKPLDEDDLEGLERNNQTQGRAWNVMVEPVELNTPLF